MTSIVFFGECMLETHPDNTFRFGGDTLNTALYLARMTNQDTLTVCYATALGVDDSSNKLLQCWECEGINTQYVSQIEDKYVGSYSIQTDKRGERRFMYDRLNSAARYYFQHKHTKLYSTLNDKSADYFYLSGISLAILTSKERTYLLDMLTAFNKRGGYIIFDNNYREVLWKGEDPLGSYHRVMSLSDLVFLTDEDEYALYGGNTVESILARTDQWQIPEVVIKQGEQPCIIKHNNQLYTVDSVPLPTSKIVDTCAAGDAFSAGYLAQRLLGKTPTRAATFAHQVAAEVIQNSGAIIPKDKMLHLMS